MSKVYSNELTFGESSTTLGVSATTGETGHKILFDSRTLASTVVTLSAVHKYVSTTYDSEILFNASSETLGVTGSQGTATSKLVFNATTLAGAVVTLSAAHAGVTYEFNIDEAYDGSVVAIVDADNLATTYTVTTGASAALPGSLTLTFNTTVYTFSVDIAYHGATFAIVDENRFSTEFTIATTASTPISSGVSGTNAMSPTLQRLWAMGYL